MIAVKIRLATEDYNAYTLFVIQTSAGILEDTLLEERKGLLCS